MRIALLGLGLVGGSIARALRRPATEGTPANLVAPTLVAWTPSGNAPQRAAEAGVVDVAAESLDEAVAGASIVVLAAPPIACLALLDELAGLTIRSLGDDAVITDVASTKVEIVDRAERLGLRFVGGHPMAGREVSGFAASEAGLFDGRPWVIVPGPGVGPAAPGLIAALAARCGASPRLMDARSHDAAVAAISHLPLIVAAAIADAVIGNPDEGGGDWAVAGQLAATGWDSAVRLARGDVEMSTGIAATNGPEIVARIRAVEGSLAAWRSAIEAGDVDELRTRFEATRAKLTATDGSDRRQ